MVDLAEMSITHMSFDFLWCVFVSLYRGGEGGGGENDEEYHKEIVEDEMEMIWNTHIMTLVPMME